MVDSDAQGRGSAKRGRRRSPLLALILLALSAAANADDQYLNLIASGRFDQVVAQYQPLADRGPIDTSELHALCVSYGKLKDYEKIFQCVGSLQARGASDRRSSLLFGTPDVTPVANLLAAETNLELGRYGRAARAAESVVGWYRDAGRRDNEVLIDAVAVLALSANRLGLTADAERYLRLLERIPIDGQHAIRKARAVARVSLTLGFPRKALAALEGDFATAIKASLARFIGSGAGLGTSNWLWDELPHAYLYAKATLRSGSRSEARELLKELLRAPQAYQNGEIYWLSHFDLATIAIEEGRTAEAIDHLLEAIRTIERQRSTIRSEANKIGFIADRHDVYGRLIELLIDSGRFAEAAEIIDRASSRALVDVLAERLMRAEAPVSETERAVLDRVALQQERAGLQNPRKVDLPLKTVLFEYAQDKDSLEGLTDLSSDLRSLLWVRPQTLAELRQALQNDEVAVQYFAYGASVAIVWFDKERVGGTRIPSADLYGLVTAFRRGLNLRRRMDDVGQSLYELLLKPVAGLNDIKRLVVIPSGPLHYLPFVALTDGKRALVDHVSVLTLPSLSVLKLLRGQPHPESAAKAGMLALGNPDLGSERFDLPSAADEVRTLGQLTGATVLLRKQASREEFLKRHSAYRILHFATHGEYDSEVPLRSALLLSPTAGRPGELRAEEILNLRVNADLITMSACATGLGFNLRGDELIGLNRAWFFAGARNVVASLWQVDDRATSQLMTLFYRFLENTDVESALRLAQFEVRKTYPSPYFWAAFYVSGRGGPVKL